MDKKEIIESVKKYIPTPDKGYILKLNSGGYLRDQDTWKLTLQFQQHHLSERTEAAFVVDDCIVWRDKLTAEEREKVEVYLAHKWGIDLPDGHPYKTRQPESIAPIKPLGTMFLADAKTIQNKINEIIARLGARQ